MVIAIWMIKEQKNARKGIFLGASGIKIVKSLTETSRNVGNFLSKPRLAKPDW